MSYTQKLRKVGATLLVIVLSAVVLALIGKVGVSSEVPTARASDYPQADYRPGTDNPYCQWSLESGRKVLVIGKKVTKAKVTLTNGRNFYAKPEPRRIPQRYRLTWVKIPNSSQEDEIERVACKVRGKWYTAEPS